METPLTFKYEKGKCLFLVEKKRKSCLHFSSSCSKDKLITNWTKEEGKKELIGNLEKQQGEQQCTFLPDHRNLSGFLFYFYYTFV